MTDALSLKPDLHKSLERFEAWWRNEVLDRPPITLWMPPAKPAREISGGHPHLESAWMDVEYQIDLAEARLEVGTYLADTLPIYMPNVGPELTGTLYGCGLEFGEHTTWSTPIVHEQSDWETFVHAKPDFTNRFWRAVEAMTELSLERGRGKWLTGTADLHGNYDILASLREPIELCVDVAEIPDLLQKVGRNLSRGFVESFERLWGQIQRGGQRVSTSWLPSLHAGPSYIPSCDFWCMVSGEFAKDRIWPDIALEMKPLTRSIFHLDGPQALRHLDLVLELPGLSAVQWVYGAGNGPASKWIDVYRRIQQAGKGFYLEAERPQDAWTVLNALDGPRGVWLTLGGFDSTASAEGFVRDVESWSRKSRR